MYYQRELIYVATEQNKTLKINSGHNLLKCDALKDFLKTAVIVGIGYFNTKPPVFSFATSGSAL
jgi:hypothetical protein